MCPFFCQRKGHHISIFDPTHICNMFNPFCSLPPIQVMKVTLGCNQELEWQLCCKGGSWSRRRHRTNLNYSQNCRQLISNSINHGKIWNYSRKKILMGKVKRYFYRFVPWIISFRNWLNWWLEPWQEIGLATTPDVRTKKLLAQFKNTCYFALRKRMFSCQFCQVFEQLAFQDILSSSDCCCLSPMKADPPLKSTSPWGAKGWWVRVCVCLC